MKTLETKRAEDGTALKLKRRSDGGYIVTESGSSGRTGRVATSRAEGKRQLDETARLYGSAEEASNNQPPGLGGGMGGLGGDIGLDDGDMGGGFFGGGGGQDDPLPGENDGFGSDDFGDGFFGGDSDDGGDEGMDFDGPDFGDDPFGIKDEDTPIGNAVNNVSGDDIRERGRDVASGAKQRLKSVRDRLRR
jgi:hypothetical protein